MNGGGDTRPDDDGLPAVDVVVPDDASELDRDVQAYYRELRARRRRQRLRRLLAPLSRDGMVLPVLAGCLALTLLAGALLTVFTAGETVGGPPATGERSRGTTSPASTRPHHQHPASHPVGQMLPGDPVTMANGLVEPLTNLTAGKVLVLALVPAGCQCLSGLLALTGETAKAGTAAYLVGLGPSGAVVNTLAHKVGLAPSHAVVDASGALEKRFRPAGLTAVVVGADGSVAQVVPEGHGFALLPLLHQLVAATAVQR